MKINVLALTSTLLSLSLLPSSILAYDRTDNCTTSSTTLTKTATASSTGQPSATNRPFGLIAAHSTSRIHLQPIEAQGTHFFISNGGPTAYCPVPPLSPGQCPPGTSTVFIAANGAAGLVRLTLPIRSCLSNLSFPFFPLSPGLTISTTLPYLTYTNTPNNQAVEVPGGQQIYVAANGALTYTSPHSHAIPPGAALGTFTYTAPAAAGNGLGHFGFTGLGATGFVACPVGTNTVGSPWQVFADVQGGEWGRCIGFDGLASEYKGLGGEFGAWEYI